tara:strand:- start:186 stop:428 length:243 start_codon:yes stop_codon:yes gene_type:complete
VPASVSVAALLVLTAAGASSPDGTDAQAGLSEAARERGCEPVEIRALGVPHAGVYEIRCSSGHIIWLRRVDGAWTIHQLG